MKARTRDEWLSLFKEHKESGLNATEFCKGKSLNPKYFSLRRKQLLNDEPKQAFVRASTVRSAPPKINPISLQGRFGILSLPDSTSPEWLASFIKALA